MLGRFSTSLGLLRSHGARCMSTAFTSRILIGHSRKHPSNCTHDHTKPGLPLSPLDNRVVRFTSTSTNKPAKERIKELINGSPKKVFVFMKGVPEQPACGYSNAVIQILNAYEVEYDSFNVLEDDEIRQEIKVYSNWPTIPQVYIDKNFIGGCDILIQMHQSDELEKLFEDVKQNSS